MLPSFVLWMVSRADVCCGQLSIFNAVLHSEHLPNASLPPIGIISPSRQAMHLLNVKSDSNYLGMLHLLSTFGRAYMGDNILEVWNFLNLEVCFWCKQ